MTFEQAFFEYILPIGSAFLLAWIIHRMSARIVRPLIRLGGYAPRQVRLREERRRTLNDLLASSLSFLVFLAAGIFSMGQFIETTTLVWMIGLFSAAFGLGARPLISDLLTGVGFIFEDTFSVGEKVEILGVEGVIEEINLRTTLMRAPTGEVYTIPNGEIRMIRNFSRGVFSSSNIKVMVHSADLEKALPLLEALGVEAAASMPNLLEAWHIINTSGMVGQQAELTLLVKARFGTAAELRPRLLALIQKHLAENDISLAD